MFVYDRRRAFAPDAEASRERLSIPQKVRVTELESSGWRLHCVRGDDGRALLVRDREALWVRPDGSWAVGGAELRAGELEADDLADAVYSFESTTARSNWRRDHRG